MEHVNNTKKDVLYLLLAELPEHQLDITWKMIYIISRHKTK